MRDSEAEEAGRATKQPPRGSRRGLDWFTFFVADIQTGFGPFLSVYLTTQKWTQVDIGLVLSIGSIVSLLGQVPGGWLVDWARSKQRAAALAVIGIGVSALIIAWRRCSRRLSWRSCCTSLRARCLGPAVAAITLGLVGHAAVGSRLGRNARFAAIGNGLAAGVMGACGYFVSAQAVFFVTAVLAIPALLALSRIREADVDPVRADGGIDACAASQRATGIGRLLRQPRAHRAYGLCPVFPLGQFGHAAARRQRRDDAVEPMGHRACCGLHHRPAARRRDRSRRPSAGSPKAGAGGRCS